MDDLLRKFTDWIPWSARKDISKEILQSPGVYVMGCFDSATPSGKPMLSQKIVYIGETCDRSLRVRLYEFGRSAFDNKSAHSGGSTFHAEYENEIVGNAAPSWLYLSILGVPDVNASRSAAFIRYVERALLWGYVDIHGGWPKCNSK